MVNDFIKDYFNLTGRPISTMTVEEYIAFQSLADKKNISTSIIKEERNNSNEASESTPNRSNKASVIDKTIISSNDTPIAVYKAKTEPSSASSEDKKNMALAMLQSVQG